MRHWFHRLPVYVLFSLLSDRFLYLALAIFTGMRRGEILGLKWEDVDIHNNTISVIRNATYTNNQPHVGAPKTKSGERIIPIMPYLLNYLLPLKSSGFIIGNGETPITLTRFKTIFKRIKAKVDLRQATSHSFRHTLGTLLFSSGADVKTIQGILGQRDFKTTADRYIHPVEQNKQAAIMKMNQLFIASAS